MEKEFIEKFAEVLELDETIHLNRDTEFRSLEQWDSIAYLSLIAMIDEEFGVVIDGKDFQKFKTLGDLIDFIASKRV